jgi:hypothetical protein
MSATRRIPLPLGLSLLVLSPAVADDIRPRADRRITSRDNTVMMAVLDNMLREQDSKGTVFFPPYGSTRPLLVDSVPSCHALTIDGVLERADEKRWTVLTSTEVRATREAAEDLATRAPVCGGEFAMVDRRIALRNGARENTGLFNGSATAFPPGYSRDGRLALVLISFPWSIHIASGTYVLVFVKGGWQVRLRDYAHSL